MKKTINFNDYLIQSLKNKKEASAYLNVALEEYKKDNDTEAFLLALRAVAEAQGGLSYLAQKTKLNRQNLYKALSGNGNPQLTTLGNILNGLDAEIYVEAVQKYFGKRLSCMVDVLYLTKPPRSVILAKAGIQKIKREARPKIFPRKYCGNKKFPAA